MKMKLRNRTLTPIFTAAALLAPAADAQTTLKLAFPPPPISMLNGQGVAPWSKEVEAATGGAVQVQIFPGPAVASFGNVYDRILNGVVDIGFGLFGPYSTQFPKISVTQVPFEPATPEEAATALWRLYEKGVIADELAKVKPLAMATFSPSAFQSPKPIATLDHLKGQKISVGSRMQGRVVELLDGSPVTMTTTDVYQSLQRGLVDTALLGYAATLAFKLYEVSNHFLEAPLGMSGNFVFMNKDSFAKLPEAARKAIDKVSGETLSRRMAKAAMVENEHGREKMEKMAGKTVNVVPDAEIARRKELFAPLTEEWLKETPDGAKVLAAYRAEVAAIRSGK